MKNLRKKIFGALAVIGLGRCVFSPQGMMPNIAHADGVTNGNNTLGVDKISFLEIMDLVLKIVYVLLWPLLVLAGMALDNSMVYGSFLHMDAPLWQFWNMTKNFANFALGFMVLIAILKSIFTLAGTKGPMDVIKKTLIAGILIQASWFLMAALVDISTVATYAVGGMPMSILKTSKTINNKKLLMTESSLDLNNAEQIKKNDFEVRYKTYTTGTPKTEIFLSPCATKDLNGETYIIGRKYGDLKFKNEKTLADGDQQIRDTSTRPTRNICIFGQKVFFFNEFPNTRNAMTPEAYESTLKDNINQLGDQAQQLEKCKFIININSSAASSSETDCGSVISALISDTTVTEPARTILKGFDSTLIPATIDNTEYGYSSGWLDTTAATTIGEIIDKSKGFVGPLVTIYASLMDFSSLPDTAINNVSLTKGIGDFLFRTGVAIGLFFPLLALAMVLIARIGFLRGIIAASPLVILAEVFKIDILKKQINIANVIKTIFAPVITVFALSICLVFMTTISDMLSFNNIEKIDVLRNMQIDKTDGTNYDTYDIIGQKIQLPKSVGMYVGATGDVFSWMIVSFCGIGMMWFILFAAIKASGTIGESVGKSVETFGSNFMKTLPIIPTPLGNAGLGTIKDKLSESNAQNYRENNVVKLPQQKQNMDAYLESKAPQFFKGDNFGKDGSFSENPIETEEIARRLARGDIEGARNYAIKEQGLTANSLADPTNINAIKAFGEKNLSKEERKIMLNSLDQTSGGSESINTIKSSVVTAADKDAANKLLEQMKSDGKINPDNITNEFVVTLKDKKEYTYNKDKNELELKQNTTPPSTN